MITVHTSAGWLGKTSVIATRSFACSVCTIRKNLFGPLRLVICEGIDGYDSQKVIGTLVYHPFVSKEGIFHCHDVVAVSFDASGESGNDLACTSEGLKRTLENEGNAFGYFYIGTPPALKPPPPPDTIALERKRAEAQAWAKKREEAAIKQHEEAQAKRREKAAEKERQEAAARVSEEESLQFWASPIVMILTYALFGIAVLVAGRVLFSLFGVF